MDGFTTADTATLNVIRGNLLRGLDEVARSLAAGTFNSAGQRGAAPPAQSGQTTLALLTRINDELAGRTANGRTAA